MNFDWTILHWIQNTLVCPAMDFLMPKITLLGNGGAVWILAAGVLSAATGLVTAAAADFWCLAAAFVLFGLGEGLWDVAVNVQAMSGQRRWNQRVMLIMHALYSAGSVIGAAGTLRTLCFWCIRRAH